VDTLRLTLALLALPALLPAAARGAPPVEALYTQHCAVCHGPARLGGTGPALLPENLQRLRRSAAIDVIAKGRIATQMQGFAGKLSGEEIRALAEYVYTPPAVAPSWTIAEMRASRVVHPPARPDSDRPTFDADPMNLFVVVETGDHHATILDGDRFEPLARFKTRYALHGGPKFSPDGRYVYFGSRDGWVSKYDLYNLRMVSEIRAGINTRNIAVSSDGRFVMVANYLPHSLVALDAVTLEPLKVIEAADAHGKSSRVSAVYDAAPRGSFIAALKDLKEIWEIPYSASAEPVYRGLVHDYRNKEGIAEKGPFPVRVIEVDDYLDDFFFDEAYANVVGAARGAKRGQVVNLNVRRSIESIDLPGLPHLGSGITWQWHGRQVLATPNLKEPIISVIDTKTWKVVKEIRTPGPGFFLRSHENTPYAWTDSFNSPRHDTLTVIDKQSLEIVAELRPAPGKIAAHVEFTADGRYALASIWEMDGAIVVYDATSLKEVKRLPMKKPSGKYNVHNKITRSEGTSH
jgi:mono/diheme cytochrome c family protein/DNA-binding beta-propeller fold protein YncE